MRTIAAATVLLLATCVVAQEKKVSRLEFDTLKAVDGNRIILAEKLIYKKGATGPEKIPEITLKVSPDAKIILNRKPAKVDQLKLNYSIAYHVDEDMNVVEIRQQTETLGALKLVTLAGTGKLESIKNGKLTLSNSEVYPISKDVKVVVDGNEAKLEDLKIGELTFFEATASDLTIFKIRQGVEKK